MYNIHSKSNYTAPCILKFTTCTINDENEANDEPII